MELRSGARDARIRISDAGWPATGALRRTGEG